MKNKKLAMLATIFLMAASTAVGVGCKKPKPAGPNNSSSGGNNSSIITETEELKLDSQTLSMTIGEEGTLIAEYAQKEGATLSFTSSDENVVTVDQNGKLLALHEGTATITVKYGDLTATCTVMVGFNGIVPVLNIPGVPTDEITMNDWAVLDLNATVSFNGTFYEDATFTYELSNPSVGVVENGIFTPTSFGSTEITVKASWRNADAATLTKTITVNVVPEWTFNVNDGVTEITLYTEAKDGYATTSPFVVTAEMDGQALPVNVTVTSGADSVEYDPVNKQVKSLGLSGEATITVSFEMNGATLERGFSVFVKPTIYDWANGTVENFSAMHGDIVVGSNFETLLGGEVVEAYDNDGTALEVVDGKVYGVKTSSEGKTSKQITVCTRQRGYVMDIEGYTGILTKATDFAMFELNVEYSKDKGGFVAMDETKAMGNWNGYYILANNIDASEYDHYKPNGKNLQGRGVANEDFDYGFHGTLDGQGYTVKGITLGQYGLFGYVDGATIKNIGFYNTTLYANKDYVYLLAQWVRNSTISNVYASFYNTKYDKGGAFFAGDIYNCVMEGCYIETKTNVTVPTTDTSTRGSLTYQSKENIDGQIKSTFSEVYVVSNVELGYRSNNFLIGENETAGTAEGMKYYTLTGVRRYADAAAMGADTAKTFTKFNTEFWDVSGNTPVWKQAKGTYPEIEQPEPDPEPDPGEGEDPVVTPSQEVVKDFNKDWLN
mgnify:CR=1 FL=1